MNENLNLVEILKDCPYGTPLYSPIYGDVILYRIDINTNYPIVVGVGSDVDCVDTCKFTNEGHLFDCYKNGEVLLFPSKEQRDWSKFKVKKPKFDPKTLKPFDRVLVKSGDFPWRCDIFSFYRENKRITCYCTSDDYIYDKCIPYNEETKHLVGTCKYAPELYRYWEE